MACGMFALSWVVLERMEGARSSLDALSWFDLAGFYAGIALSYLLVFVQWTQFSDLAGRRRTRSDAFVDTGLLALAKYVPGKVWGVMMRGAVSGQRVSVKREHVWRSFSEQLATLLFGVIVLGGFLLVASAMRTDLALAGCAVLFAAGCAVLPRLVRAGGEGGPALPVARLVVLGVGYCALWLASVLPFVIVVVNLSLPAPDELVPIVAAFLASSIAGWIAIVAPAGFGVREAVFVFAHPSRAMVQEGLGWIVLHRALFTLFDLLFGVAAIIVICLRNRVSGR